MKRNIYGNLDNESYLAIRNAICHYVFCKHQFNLSDDLLKKILKCINPNSFDDRELLNIPKLKNLINWNLLGRKQLIRIMTRDTSIIEKIDLNQYKFKINELEMFLKVHPEYVDVFEINFENLTAKEVISLLNIDVNYIDKIDIKKINFSRLEYLELITSFSFEEKIILKLNFELLDNTMIKKILISTGNKFIKELPMEKIIFLDWLDILKEKPELFEYCDIKQFEKNDCYYLCKLVCFFPPAYEYVIKNLEKIGPGGWELLLISNPDKFAPICKFNKLTEKNWNYILQKAPQLEKYYEIQKNK